MLAQTYLLASTILKKGKQEQRKTLSKHMKETKENGHRAMMIYNFPEIDGSIYAESWKYIRKQPRIMENA